MTKDVIVLGAFSIGRLSMLDAVHHIDLHEARIAELPIEPAYYIDNKQSRQKINRANMAKIKQRRR